MVAFYHLARERVKAGGAHRAAADILFSYAQRGLWSGEPGIFFATKRVTKMQRSSDRGEGTMDLNETVIGSETIYQGKIVCLRLDRVRLPDGRESKREIVEHHGAVCIVPVRDDRMVLMVRQFRLAAGKILLEIPAGTLEAGEAPLACAARELEEETGYRAAHLQPLFSAYLAPGYSTELIHAYLATGLTLGRSHTDEDENVELVPVSLDEIERKIQAGEFQDAKTISALLVAKNLIHRLTQIDTD
jgi:8-oxo-dGTP pyrophosphatase MutT (NUDIX family)